MRQEEEAKEKEKEKEKGTKGEKEEGNEKEKEEKENEYEEIAKLQMQRTNKEICYATVEKPSRKQNSRERVQFETRRETPK